MIEYLAFVRKIGETINRQNIYEFMFSTNPDIVWGDNFNIVPAGIIPDLIPEKNCLSKKGRVITDIDLYLACQSTCFSMMDCIDGIIALCFTEAGIENEILACNTLCHEDAIRAIYMLKAQMGGESIAKPEKQWNPNVKDTNIELISNVTGKPIELVKNETSLPMSQKRREKYS